MACIPNGLGFVAIALAAFACGARAGDDVSVDNTVGGRRGNGSGFGTGGVAASVPVSTGAVAPSDGLVPLSPDELSNIQVNACHATSSDGGASWASCWLPRPPGTTVCGGEYTSATVEQIRVVITDTSGVPSLVTNTTPDCPLGNGYWIDEVNDRLGLCSSTCDALQTGDVTATVYGECGPASLCIY